MTFYKTSPKFPLLLPSHNCIIIHNVQFSRCNRISLKKFNEASSFKGTSVNFLWWRVPGSNRWPPACKAGALPAELTPHIEVVGQGLAFLRESHGGCNSPPACCQVPPFESTLACSPSELSQSRSWLLLNSYKWWWAKVDSNHRPHDYQSCALASWAIGPYRLHIFLRYIILCTL